MSRPVMSRFAPPPMTDEEAERLRALVPDDPVPLPPGHLACQCCGVAVQTTEAVTLTEVEGRTPGGQWMTTPPVGFARCPSCCSIHQRAREYVDAHPALAVRIGPDIAREHIESVLFGLAILGQAEPADLGLLLPRLHPAAHGVRFNNPLTLVRDHCSPRAWAHVTTSQRAGLRKAFAAVLRDRLALSEPPVAIPCPSSACVFCGVRAVNRAAIEVARRGGVEAVSHAVWRAMDVSPVALGATGPDLLWVHFCPDCCRAIDDVGAVGLTARAQTLVSFVARSSIPKAERLRALVEGEFPPLLPAWRVVPKARPSAQPWAHLRRVIDRL